MGGPPAVSVLGGDDRLEDAMIGSAGGTADGFQRAAPRRARGRRRAPKREGRLIRASRPSLMPASNDGPLPAGFHADADPFSSAGRSAVWIGIRRGRASSALGRRNVSTPSCQAASMRSVTMPGPRLMVRRKVP